MRSIALYVVAAAVVMLAMDMIAPTVGLGLSVFALPSVDGSAMHQSVDRTHKADRPPVPTVNGRQIAPMDTQVLVGCEPVFSPLSKDKHANFSGFCAS